MALFGPEQGVVNLSKGATINLSKKKPGLKNIVVGLGWDTNKYSGGAEFDLDASVFMCNENEKTPVNGFIFYNRLSDVGTMNGDEFVPDYDNSSVVHMGDNRTGEGEGDDEQIVINLEKVPDWVQKIAITVTIFDADQRKQNFGQVSNAYCRLVNKDTDTEEVRFDLGEDFAVETAIVVGEVYRRNGDWSFRAIGSGFSGGLEALCSNYGLTAEYR